MKQSKVFVLMGVSGCGKSAVGSAAAAAAGCRFIDADDHHPEANIRKMSAGIALTDADRLPWIAQLCRAMVSESSDCVVACSALTAPVREALRGGLPSEPVWLHLSGSASVIAARLAQRSGHFMDARLLDSQFAALQTEPSAIVLDIEWPLATLVDRVVTIIRSADLPQQAGDQKSGHADQG